jgi:hypothetical protein
VFDIALDAFRDLHASLSFWMGQNSRNRPKNRFYKPQDEEIVKARAEQRREFDSILQDVNKFVYSNMTGTRKERALKKQWENARAEALGCTPEKGVNHGFKHLKAMREAKARKREVATEKARMGEDVDTRHILNRDITEVRRLRKEKRKEARDRKRNRGMGGETAGSKLDVNKVIKKFGVKVDKKSNTNNRKGKF